MTRAVRRLPREKGGLLLERLSGLGKAGISLRVPGGDRAGLPAADVFGATYPPVIKAIGKPLDGRTERQRDPHPPDTLARATWIRARLGG